MRFDIGEEDFQKIMELVESRCSQGFGIDNDNPFDGIKIRLLFQYGSQIKTKEKVE